MAHFADAWSQYLERRFGLHGRVRSAGREGPVCRTTRAVAGQCSILIERASEAIFGVLMAVSITGSLSVATAGRQEIRTMLMTAIGCNLAWGLTDAVMLLIGAASEKRRRVDLLERLRETNDRKVAHRLARCR